MSDTGGECVVPDQIGVGRNASYARETVTRALSLNPRLTWTCQGLAVWFGLRLSDVQNAVASLMERGLLNPATARTGTDGWHEWGVPITPLVWVGDLTGKRAVAKAPVLPQVA